MHDTSRVPSVQTFTIITSQGVLTNITRSRDPFECEISTLTGCTLNICSDKAVFSQDRMLESLKIRSVSMCNIFHMSECQCSE